MITVNTIGTGRIGLKYLFALQASKVDKEYLYIVGNHVEKTRQVSEVIKQYIPLGPMQPTPEGVGANFEDMTGGFTAVYRPNIQTKGVKFSVLAEYTDQYNVLKQWAPRFSKASIQRRNAGVADLDNSGFTTTSYGMNSETLYSASHLIGNSGGSTYGYNRPLAPGQTAGTSATTLDIAFSPAGLQQARADIHKQKDAKGEPWFPMGKLCLKVPVALDDQARRAVMAPNWAGTNWSDPNTNKMDFVDVHMLHNYSSDTAWFVLASDPEEHGLFLLEGMPLDIVQLPMGEDISKRWIAFESWVPGWRDWHGSWGTLGA